MKVKKKSGKPFKSGKKIATVRYITVNGQDPKSRAAYTFYEDDSVVNIDTCEEITI